MKVSVGSVPLQVATFGLFGAGNIGNDATLAALLDELRARAPAVGVKCVCTHLPRSAVEADAQWLPLDPAPIRGLWRLRFSALMDAYATLAGPAFGWLRARRAACMLRDVDALLIVGTGILDDFGMQPWQVPSCLLAWCKAAKMLGKPLHFVAVGAGPIRRKPNRTLLLRAVQMSDSRSLRDQTSRSFLAENGIDSNLDQVIPDLAFGLVRPTDAIRKPLATPRVVGLGVMGYFGWAADPAKGRGLYARYIDEISAFAVSLLRAGYDLRVLVGEIPTDLKAVQDLTERIGSLAPEHLAHFSAPTIFSVEELLNAIASTDIVVATRYHNVVCALALGRPVVSVGYASKFRSLMENVGLARYCQEIETLDSRALFEQFTDLVSDFDSALRRVAAATDAYRATLSRYYDGFFDRLSRDRPARYRPHASEDGRTL